MILLYIDPGTGSMLFTILIGIISAAIYGLRALFIKLKFLFLGGRQDNQSGDRLPFVIFTDSKRYWNTFGPICREFDRRGEKIWYYTASPDDPALKESFQNVTCEFIGEGNMAFARMNLVKADIVLSSTPSLDVYQWKRSRDVSWYVHILHACNDPVTYRMFGLDYYDAVLLSGDYQIDQLRFRERSRQMPEKELVITGLPYMDELQKRLLAAPPLEKTDTVTVLVAPSWGANSILSRYGGTILDALLKTGYHIIVRPHPQSYTSDKGLLDELMSAYPPGPNLEWNRDNDNFDVLRKSDILISDFSGVIFDYTLIFDKPILYADTSFDRSALDCWDMEEELWTFRILPKIGRQLTRENLPDIKELIDRCLQDPSFKEARDIARDETWQCRGEGTVRAVDYLMQKRKELYATAE